MIISKLDMLCHAAQNVDASIKQLATREIGVIPLKLGKLDLHLPARKMMLIMLVAVVKMARDLLIERTQSALARAKAEGKTLCRPSKTTQERRTELIVEYANGGRP